MLIIGAVVLVIALAAAVDVSFSPAPVRVSGNVYVDPNQSLCKGGSGTFACTIVLDARQGNLSASQITSVSINGTNTKMTVTSSGGHVMVSASVQTIVMQHGLGDVGPSQRPPTVGSIIVNLSDGTEVAVVLGPAGILP
jgi:outer membrane protein assembly factor BamB